MSNMSNKNIRLLSDLGAEFKRTRKKLGISASALAQKAGRSRYTLYRLEKGEEVSTGTLLDFLLAMGCSLSIESSGLPSLEEMRQRFNFEETDE